MLWKTFKWDTTQDNASHDSPVSENHRIRHGTKDNRYIVVDNAEKIDKKRSGKISEHPDDCGTWLSTHRNCNRTSYLVHSEENFEKLFVRDGLYCKENKVNRKRTYVPLSPHSSADAVMVIYRGYSKLKADPTFCRRVTRIEKSADSKAPSQNAVVEYIGNFPGLFRHGSNKAKTQDYVRTPSHILNDTGHRAKMVQPKMVYNDMILENSVIDAPRDMKQIRNVTYRQNSVAQSGQYKQNFADNMQMILNMAQRNEFLQHFVISKAQVPSVILYLSDQVHVLKRFCCSGQSVLRVDKTFNLGQVFVTTTVFKHKALPRTDTDENPIFSHLSCMETPLLKSISSSCHTSLAFSQLTARTSSRSVRMMKLH